MDFLTAHFALNWISLLNQDARLSNCSVVSLIDIIRKLHIHEEITRIHEIDVMTITAPLVVVGSVNADIYVEVDKLPKEGETIVAKSGHTFAGGKGANQAACAARLSYPTYLVGQV